ncbi:ATP-binding protein [Burkholderia cenocepacia]|uniref:ATP-binding protein n=1 Tax=Burkholderia cenocepacia TaxID=95486 RepID=UPI00285ED394|nr:transporter substrate-binding domain-containing protein [Burkholderia cenocepacia]MDR8050298.1 transporter substrate-binding domain-containing protein [Burkholderia cenocepacia]
MRSGRCSGANLFRLRTLVFLASLCLCLGLARVAYALPDATVAPAADALIHHLHSRPAIDAAAAAVLARKPSLRVGMIAHMQPVNAEDGADAHQGIASDYLTLLGHVLTLQWTPVFYADANALEHALDNGEIDAAVTAAESRDANRDTSPFFVSPVIVATKATSQVAQDLAGKKLVFVSGTLSRDTLAARFPNSTLLEVGNYYDALEAVELGRAAAYAGESAPLSAYANSMFFPTLEISRELPNLEVRWRFRFSRQTAALRPVFDSLLSDVDTDTQQEINGRWLPSRIAQTIQPVLALTDAERDWIRRHPVVHVAVPRYFIPFAFENRNGQFSGIASNLLDVIERRTGLRFHATHFVPISDTYTAIESGAADMGAAATPAPDRRAQVDFSLPYAATTFAIVTRAGDWRIATLDDLCRYRVASIHDQPDVQMLRKRCGQSLRTVPASDGLKTLDLVATGAADAALHVFPTADFLINRYYPNRLHISGTSNSTAIPLRFAVSKQHPELHSILDKAIRSLSKRDLRSVTDEWNYFDELPFNWNPYRSKIVLLAAVIGAITLCLLGWIVVLRCRIHARRRRERVLREQLSLQIRMIDAMPNPTYMWGVDGHLIACNQALLDTTGRTREQMIGSTLADDPGLDDDSRNKLRHAITSINAGQQKYVQELSISLKGSRLHGLHWAVPVNDEKGRLIGILAGWTDITDRRLIEERLREAKAAAEAANRAKSMFVATTSHEIRTPLHAALGNLELLAREPLKRRSKLLLESVQQSFHSLQSLLNDILDFSKLEAKELVIEQRTFDPVALADECAQALAPLAHRKDLAFTLLVDAALPDALRGDPARLRQILLNLGTNAIKFTERGNVTLEIAVIDRHDDACQVRISLVDTGIGMSPAEIERVFSPFSQANNTVARRFGGTGLGLSICKRLVELMNGRIDVASTPGRGSTFTVDLPLRVVDATPAALTPPSLDTTRITLVSEDALLRESLRAWFERWGASVLCETLSEQCNDTTPPSDIMVIAGAKLHELVPPPIKIVQAHLACILLAGDGPVTPEADAGCYAVSALNHSGLAGVLTAAAAGQLDALLRSDATPDRHHDSYIRRFERIVVAEDEPVGRRLLERQLHALGFEDVVATENGEAALRACQRQPVDLVITDLGMPVIGGIELIRALREASRSIPVMISTAATDGIQSDDITALDIRAVLHKPLSLSELKNAIDRVLPTPSSEYERHLPAPTDERTAIDVQIDDELLTLFKDSWQQSDRAIATALQAGDYASLRRELHRLGSALMVMGNAEAIQICDRMSAVSNEADPDELLRTLYTSLEQSILQSITGSSTRIDDRSPAPPTK